MANYSVFNSAVDNISNIQPTFFPDFNETIRFSGNTKTYEELVYTSRIRETLNLSIEVLTNDSETSRLALRNKKKGMNVVPRPQNSWIIYRRDKYVDPEFAGVKSCIASIKIGDKWKNESNEVLEYFAALSMLALKNHQKKYGGYKYQPRVSRKSKKSKDRQRRTKENVENISPEINNETIDLPHLVTFSSPEINNETMDFPQLVTFSSSPEINNETMDFPQLVTFSSPPTNEYPTPVSSITYSPVACHDDYSEQTSNNSYYITPPSSIQQSSVTFQDQNSHLLTNQDSAMISEPMNSYNYPMYPELSTITPIDNNSSTFNNNPSETFLGFFNNGVLLAASQPSQSSPNTTTTNLDVNVNVQPDFVLYDDALMPNILDEPTIIDQPANIDQFQEPANRDQLQEPTIDQLEELDLVKLLQSYNLSEYVNYLNEQKVNFLNPVSINSDPSTIMDLLDFSDINGPSL